jgi:hypothetical protein
VAGKPKQQSIFQNITVTSSAIKITKNTSAGYTNIYSETYVGAIAGHATDAKFEGCVISLGDAGNVENDLTKTVNITAILEGGSNTILAVGGVAGYANNCEFNNNSSKGGDAYRISVRLTVAEGSSGSPKVYAGALLGVQDSGVNIGETNICLAKRIVNATNYNEIALVGEKK